MLVRTLALSSQELLDHERGKSEINSDGSRVGMNYNSCIVEITICGLEGVSRLTMHRRIMRRGIS